MAKAKRVTITILMVVVWGWTLFMSIFASHLRGRLASLAIGILINVALAVYYSYLVKRPRTFREWFNQ